MHNTGSKPHNSEVDVPLNYADYYYVEALLGYKNKIIGRNDLAVSSQLRTNPY